MHRPPVHAPLIDPEQGLGNKQAGRKECGGNPNNRAVDGLAGPLVRRRSTTEYRTYPAVVLAAHDLSGTVHDGSVVLGRNDVDADGLGLGQFFAASTRSATPCSLLGPCLARFFSNVILQYECSVRITERPRIRSTRSKQHLSSRDGPRIPK